jgi:hypothetical protein
MPLAYDNRPKDNSLSRPDKVYNDIETGRKNYDTEEEFKKHPFPSYIKKA